MSGEPTQPGLADTSRDVGTVPPAPGGTIEDYLKATGGGVAGSVIAADGRSAWVPCSRGELQRWPVECTDEVDKATIRALLRRKGVWFINYLLDPATGPYIPNCFDYVCSDPAYDIERLAKNARRDIRRGLRSFVVRRISWDELLEHGFPALADTAGRHGELTRSPDRLRQFTDRVRNSPCHEAWGAWQGEDLAAWLAFAKIDDYATIFSVCSCTAAHRGCPNNAVLYEVTRHCLIEEKRRFVSLGLSSVLADPNQWFLHKYKVRMGYEALPRFRRFVLHPLLRPMLGTRSASVVWDMAYKLKPDHQKLSRLAGMARLLSGRQADPLAWAEKDKQENSD